MKIKLFFIIARGFFKYGAHDPPLFAGGILFKRGSYKIPKQGMRINRLGFKLRVKLGCEEPRVVRNLNRLDEIGFRMVSPKDKAPPFIYLAVL